jgi:hypothetical protein
MMYTYLWSSYPVYIAVCFDASHLGWTIRRAIDDSEDISGDAIAAEASASKE